jgi:hypothetical protein
MPWEDWGGPPPPMGGRCWRAEPAKGGPEQWTHWFAIAAPSAEIRYQRGDLPAVLAMSDLPIVPPPPPEPKQPGLAKSPPSDEEIEAILAAARPSSLEPSETPWNGLGGLKRLAMFVVGIAAFLFVISLANPRYEYRVVTITVTPIADQLNKLGNGGWEVVSARRVNEGNAAIQAAGYEVILKRKRVL